MDKFVEEQNIGNKLEISASEKEVVRKGLLVLHKYFQKKSDILPKCIVFPDDSARPLFWAAEPLIRSVYGGRIPPVSFLKENWATFDQQRYESWLKEKGRIDNLTSSNMYFGIQERARQRLVTKRVGEITQKSELEKDDTVLIIDDYARSWNDISRVSTRDRIRQQFANAGVNNVDYFVFMTNVIKSQDPSIDYLAGSLDTNPEAKYGWWSEGFSWRKLDPNAKASLLGVHKQNDGSLYTQKVIPNISNELRNVMSKVGQQVLEEIQR